MSYAIGVLAFVVALLVSVMLHEAGHFATAKAFGMKATRFFVGFGPTLWSFRRGETEYGVKAIPAGGFVKILGMTQLEEIEPADQPRAFWRFPAPQRTIVLAAGSVVHMIIAIVMIFGVLVSVGDTTNPRETLVVDGVAQCLPRNPHATGCTKADPKAPATGKLRAGDRIVAVDGSPVSRFAEVQQRLQSSAGKPLTLTVERGGRRVAIPLTPVGVRQHGHTVGKVGFGPVTVPTPVSAAEAVPKTFETLGTFFTSTISALGTIPSEVVGIVEGKPRNPNGAASVVDVARVSGQVAQAKVSLGLRVATLMLLVASLNFFVGIFNMLPLLPLDGGHVAILLFEQARSGVYRLLGRRDPGRVDLMKILPVTYAVVALFIGLSLVLLYAGIVNPITLQ